MTARKQPNPSKYVSRMAYDGARKLSPAEVEQRLRTLKKAADRIAARKYPGKKILTRSDA